MNDYLVVAGLFLLMLATGWSGVAIIALVLFCIWLHQQSY